MNSHQRSAGIRLGSLRCLMGCLLSSWLGAASAQVEARDVVNELRNGGCDARNKLPALQSDAHLQALAKQIARGATAQAASKETGFHATQLSTIHLAGYGGHTEMRQVLAQNYCRLLMNPTWQLISNEWRANEVWIVLAAPRTIPSDAAVVEQQVLKLVNQARAKSRRCGNESYSPAEVLRSNAMLTKAALLHAKDMAAQQRMQHEGSDGSTPAQRVTRQGYRWRAIGENVAAGADGAEEVVAGWLASPGHCANIMSPLFTEMGLAFAVNTRDDYAVYWAQSFAAPR